MNRIIEEIRKDLVLNADEKVKIQGERFFKENVKLYGLRSAMVTMIGKEHYNKIPARNKLTVFDLCEELWKSGFMEESFIACNWSYRVRKEYLFIGSISIADNELITAGITLRWDDRLQECYSRGSFLRKRSSTGL